MTTKYKYIHFEKAPKGIGLAWDCFNNKTQGLLGSISYHKPWKQYTIDFQEKCDFNSQCLRDIASFLDQINKEERPK